MASIHKDIAIDASPNDVWDAVRDFGAVHTRLAPGFVVDAWLDGDARIVTFANGNVAREQLVDCDEARRRLVYAIANERVTHYSASVQVLADGETRSRLIWIVDVLPNAIAPYIDGQMDLYGRFIGSWDLDVRQFSDDGRERRRAGEWHFGWALEGRAVQDVWIVPPRGEQRHGDATAKVNSYGTTLRVYDPDIDAWRIQWTDPVARSFLQMIGRGDGDGIVQLGTRPDRQLVRWSFRDITPNSFLWRGEISADDGASWRSNTEFTARPRPA